MDLPVNKILQGHILYKLADLTNKSVNCIITSPPYWGLRAYNTEPQVWGGDKDCRHKWGSKLMKKTSDNYNQNFNERWGNSPGQKKQEKIAIGKIIQGQFCSLCGAWRGELGLEPTIEAVEIEIMELRPDLNEKEKKEVYVYFGLGNPV